MPTAMGFSPSVGTHACQREPYNASVLADPVFISGTQQEIALAVQVLDSEVVHDLLVCLHGLSFETQAADSSTTSAPSSFSAVQCVLVCEPQ